MYICSNTYFRTMTENDFEKDTNELLANSVFGRSIQTKEMKKIYTLLQIKI